MSERRATVIYVTLSGSLHRHTAAIAKTAAEFGDGGGVILSPRSTEVQREDEEGFVYLSGDRGEPGEIERAHLAAIGRSDLLYIVNPGGYLGLSTAMEIGYALARSVPVYASDPPKESPHKFLISQKSVIEALAEVRPGMETPRLPDTPTLNHLQRFYSQVARLRDFHEETPVEILVLLVEEIGELAKAIRAMEDLTVSTSDPAPRDVGLELADCLNYLLHMANRVGVSLESAFSEKERINASRVWTRPSEL
jgi:NTP pyrophosphatase (non-canonical NTP hydrolase)